MPIRMMSVTGTNLVGENDVYEQMSLIEDNTENTKKVEQFEKTVDNLKIVSEMWFRLWKYKNMRAV